MPTVSKAILADRDGMGVVQQSVTVRKAKIGDEILSRGACGIS